MPQSESIEKPSIAEHPIAVFSNSYARLPEHFFARLSPTPVAGPHLIKFNELLAEDLGLDTRGLGADALAGRVCSHLSPVSKSKLRSCSRNMRQRGAGAPGTGPYSG
jgi:uncharacterized protein YdiU (UPF0061 family)